MRRALSATEPPTDTIDLSRSLTKSTKRKSSKNTRNACDNSVKRRQAHDRTISNFTNDSDDGDDDNDNDNDANSNYNY